MSQSRKGSLIEACTNIAVGFVISLISQLTIYPLYGIHASIETNVQITIWFTVISLARSYGLRRLFNNKVARMV